MTITTDYQLVDVLAETHSIDENPSADVSHADVPHYSDDDFASWLFGKTTAGVSPEAETDIDEGQEIETNSFESHSDDAIADEAGDAFIQMIDAASRD